MKTKINNEMTNEYWQVAWHYATGQVDSLRMVGDPTQMQWSKGRLGLPYGACFLDKREPLQDGVRHIYEYMQDIRLTVDRRLVDRGYCERYVWRNVGKKPIELPAGEYGVYVTCAEQYDLMKVARTRRAYMNTLLTERHTLVANTRLAPDLPCLGIVWQEGAAAALREERLWPVQRGDVIALLPSVTLQPDESIAWQWLFFAYTQDEEFWRVAQPYTGRWNVACMSATPGETVTATRNGEMRAAVAEVGTVKLDWDEDSLRLPVASPHYRLADGYRPPLFHSFNAPAALAHADESMTLFALTHDTGLYARAVEEMTKYYAHGGAKRLDWGIRADLIASSDRLRHAFAKQAAYALRQTDDTLLWTPRNVLGLWGVLRTAGELRIAGCEAAAQIAKIDVDIYNHTPWGTVWPQGEEENEK